MGWALREYSYVHPHSVISFVHSHEFSGLTKREALKHLKSDII
jgi:3-methyladenine DNA glycosylase AlkD